MSITNTLASEKQVKYFKFLVHKWINTKFDSNMLFKEGWFLVLQNIASYIKLKIHIQTRSPEELTTKEISRMISFLLKKNLIDYRSMRSFLNEELKTK